MHHGGGRFSSRFDKPDKQARPGTFRRVVTFFRPYWFAVILVLLAVLVMAGLGLVNPYVLKMLIDTAIPKRKMRLLEILVGLMILTPIVNGLISVGQTYLSNLIGQRVMRDMRNALYVHLQRMPLRFFTSTRTGEIQSRLSNDVGGVQTVVTQTAIGIVSNVATTVSTLALMIAISVPLTAISLALVPIFIIITRKVGAVRKELSKETQQSMADLTAITQETLSVSGILLTKTFGRQHDEIGRFGKENERLSELQIRQSMVGRYFFALVQAFFAIAPALIYFVGGREIIGGSTTLTIGGIVAFTTLQARLFMPLGQLLSVNVDIQGSLALFDRVFEYLDLESEIVDKPGALALDPATIQGRVEYDQVSFRYSRDIPLDGTLPTASDLQAQESDNLLPLALDQVDFAIKPGELVALVGPSGAGKTTITYLLPRLYDVESGAVRIDGHDVRDVTLESLGQVIGFVTQETYLFHATVRENLLYGKPDATQEELEAAARAAAIHDRIAELPDGYDTMVGERGYKLSGGEKQRLALARVILKNPRILILDEATSALDTHSERLIQAALEPLMAGRTTIAIAHRLSTILAADQILVVQRGRVVEHGNHQELLAKDGLYASLYREQFADRPELVDLERAADRLVAAGLDGDGFDGDGLDVADDDLRDLRVAR